MTEITIRVLWKQAHLKELLKHDAVCEVITLSDEVQQILGSPASFLNDRLFKPISNDTYTDTP